MARWGSVTVSGDALASARSVDPNRIPTFDLEAGATGPVRSLVMTRAADPLKGDAAFDSVSVRFVAATGQVLSASASVVADAAAPLSTNNYYAACSPCTGVSVNLVAGTVSFGDTLLTATALSGNKASSRLNGSFRLPDWRPRTGTTVTAAGLKACQITQNLVSASFADIACLAGTYVGTDADGQACTAAIDPVTQTFSFKDSVNDKRFDYSASGGFSNLSAFRSALTQSTKLSRPGVPLESIEVQVTPSPVSSNLIGVNVRNVHSVGGTLNSIYHRECRIEFDLGG